MKKVFFALLLLIIAACASLIVKPPTGIPSIITIEAQTLPITLYLSWDDPNPISVGVTNYVVRQDNVVIGTPTAKTQTVTINTLGSHTFAVRCVNLFAESPDATLTVNVVMPAIVTGLRISKTP